jgi:hypothetical protein
VAEVTVLAQTAGDDVSGEGLTLALLRRWDDVLSADHEYRIVGRFLTGRVLFQSGDTRFIVEFRVGRIIMVAAGVDPTESWDFAVRAPDETWDNFLREVPPPEYHDLWAATWRGHMTVEGETWRLLQNHYGFWRALPVLRALANSNTAGSAQ